MLLLSGLVMVVGIQQTAGIIWAGAFLVPGVGVLYLMTTKDKHGASMMDRTWRSCGSAARCAAAATGMCPAPWRRATPTAVSEHRGVLWRSKLSTHTDALGRPFALVHHGDGTLAVVMSLSPEGTDLVDLDQANDLVALWGQWLGNLSGEAGVVAASACVETCPDTGERLRRAMARQSSPQAPGLARQVIGEVVDDSTQGADDVKVWATLTFSPAALAPPAPPGRTRDFDPPARADTDAPGCRHRCGASDEGRRSVPDDADRLRPRLAPPCSMLLYPVVRLWPWSGATVVPPGTQSPLTPIGTIRGRPGSGRSPARRPGQCSSPCSDGF